MLYVIATLLVLDILVGLAVLAHLSAVQKRLDWIEMPDEEE